MLGQVESEVLGDGRAAWVDHSLFEHGVLIVRGWDFGGLAARRYGLVVGGFVKRADEKDLAEGV